MSPIRDSLALDASPRSVRDARRWVAESFAELGRGDLIANAELGVSELVTNAILHATPPISIRVRGTRQHPRVEVADGTTTPPTLTGTTDAEDDYLSTIGRGMTIVAMSSWAWGADIESDEKVVWFEPAAEPREGDVPPGGVFDFADAVDRRLESAPPVSGLLTIKLLSMPVLVFAGFRRHYAELRRELRLLSMAHETVYPIARDLTDLMLQAEQERRNVSGVEVLDRAIAEGVDRVDLTYQVPTTAPETMARLLDLSEVADAFCRAERLLSLASTPQQAALQRWYLGEFVRQGRGVKPQPWPGSFRIEGEPGRAAS